MSKLRFREHISLNDVFTRIVTSTEFKESRTANSDESEVNRMPPSAIMKQNLDFLKQVLLKYSSMYIIQEDRRSKYECLICSCHSPTLFQ